ncbi:MAG: YdgA family protein [Betaproteobacteria bacterium]|nr:YdgA family protein [Betaproteobacteria bacterium]
MKKTAIAVAVLLSIAVAADLAATYHFSRESERKTAEWTQKLQEMAPYLKISNEYQRGFFSSTQRLTLGFPGVKEVKGLTVKNVIHHGPFPGFSGVGMAKIEHSWEFDEATQKELAKGFGNESPFSATTSIALHGAGTTELRGAPASYTSGDEKVAWQGFTGTVRFTKNLDTYAGEIVAPKLIVTGKQGAINMNALAFTFDQRRMAGFDELYLGKMNMSLAEVSFKDATSDTKLEKIAFETDATSADNQFMDIKASLKAAKLLASEIDATDVDYTFSMKHLHAQSFMQLTKAMQAAGPKPGAGDAKPDTAALMAQMAAMQKAAKTHGLTLLKNEPVIAIDRINVKLKEGEIKMSGSVKVPGVTEADIEQPFNLLGKIDAAATVSIPEAFARNQYAKTKLRQLKAQQQGVVSDAQTTEVAAAAGSEFAMLLAGFAQEGYVTTEGGQLNSRLSFKGGAFLVTDKPFNPMGGAGRPMPPAGQVMPTRPPFPRQ